MVLFIAVTRKLAVSLCGALLVALVLGLAGAVEAKDVIGILSVGDGDIYTLTCGGPAHCAAAQLCDNSDSTADIFQLVISGYFPTNIIGKGETERVKSVGAGGCTPTVITCRSGSTAGMVKAVIAVTHPDGVGQDYHLYARCYDATFHLMGDSQLTLTRTTASK